MMAPCAVHVLLHGDHDDREVAYCPLCDADLCAECRSRYDLRAIAAIKEYAQSALAAMGLIPGRA